MDILDQAVPYYDTSGNIIPREPPYMPNGGRMFFFRSEDYNWVMASWRPKDVTDGPEDHDRVFHIQQSVATSEVTDSKIILELHRQGFLLDSRMEDLNVRMLEEIHGACTDIKLNWYPFVEVVRIPGFWNPKMVLIYQ